MPALSVVGSGLYTIYVPIVQQLKQFSDWLWSTNPLDKLFTDPINLIVGLYMSPLVPNSLSTNEVIKLGGKESNAYSQKALNQFQYHSCGQISIAEYYGNFIDYQSKVVLYLPYIGYKEIDISEFMDGIIKLDYLVDFATGTCIAFVRANRGVLNSVVYQYEGCIYSQIALTAQDATGLQATLASSLLQTGIGIASGNALATAQGLVSSATNIITTNKNFERSGSLNMNGGYMSVQKPYIIFTRPVQSVSAGMKKDVGYMSNVYLKLGDLKGFTKILYIDLSGISCTDEERERLMSMLKEGVYF